MERVTREYRRVESFNPKHHPDQSFHMENKQNITQNETINVSNMHVFLEISPEYYISNLNKINKQTILPMETWNRYLQHWKNKHDEARRDYLAAVNAILEQALEIKKQVEKYEEINQHSLPFSMLCKVVPENTSVSKPQMSQQLLNSTPSTLPATDTSGTTFATSSSMNLPLTCQKQPSDIKVPNQDNKVTIKKKHNTKKSPKKHKKRNREEKPQKKKKK